MTAVPRLLSPTPEFVDLEAMTLGYKMLGFEPHPQNIQTGRLLEARDAEGGALYQTVVVQMPRRSSKTTGMFATLVGRAMLQPGFKAVVTAQSGTVASSLLLEIGNTLEVNGFGGYKRSAWDDDENPGDGTMRLLRNGGRERIEFANQSRLWVVPPNATAVRGSAADVIYIDEAGEFEGERGEEFINAVLPLLDTRGPRAQIWVSGTPGKVRSGMFWDMLQKAYAGDDDMLGGIDYSMSDHDDPEDPETWLRCHPGIGTLTTMRIIERRFKDMPLPQFQREYLGSFPVDGTTSAIDMEAFNNGEREPTPLPSKYAWAFDVAPDGSSAAVVAAWRDDQGDAWVEIMAHRPGTDWLGRFIQGVAKSGQRQAITYDRIGSNLEPSARLDLMKPKVRSDGLHYTKGIVPAQQSFVREIDEGRMRHTGQPGLTWALEGAVWRQSEGFRVFGRKASTADITPAVAASMALWAYDTKVAGKTSVGSFAPV